MVQSHKGWLCPSIRHRPFVSPLSFTIRSSVYKLWQQRVYKYPWILPISPIYWPVLWHPIPTFSYTIYRFRRPRHSIASSEHNTLILTTSISHAPVPFHQHTLTCHITTITKPLSSHSSHITNWLIIELKPYRWSCQKVLLLNLNYLLLITYYSSLSYLRIL